MEEPPRALHRNNLPPDYRSSNRESWRSDISRGIHIATQSTAGTELTFDKIRRSQQYLYDIHSRSWLETDEPDSPPATRNLKSEKEANSAADQEQGEFLQGYQLWIVIGCVSSVVFLMFLDGAIISPAIPTITTEFNSLDDIGWYGSAYYLANTALQPLSGKFFTYFRSKWCLLVYASLFAFGSMLCGAATSSNMLILGRAIAGAGTSGILVGNTTVISSVAPLDKRPGLTALVMSLSAPGMLVGPLVGGMITQYGSWRWVFFLNLPFTAIVIPLLYFSHIPEQITKPKAIEVIRNLPAYIDILGFFLLATAICLFLSALDWGGNSYAWNSPVIIGLFSAAAVLLLVFLAWDMKQGQCALIPTSVAKKRVVWSGAVSLAFTLGATTIQSYFLPLYFQSIKGESPMLGALSTLPGLPGQIIFALLSGVLIGKHGHYLWWALVGTALHTLACSLFSRLTPDTPVALWVTFQLLAGSGRGMCLQSPSIALQMTLDQKDISIASSILTFGMSMGQSVASTLASSLFSNVLKAEVTAAVKELGPTSPSIEKIMIAGATGFRGVVSAEQLPTILLAYAGGTRAVFLLAMGMSGMAFCFAWGMGFGKKKVDTVDSERAEKGKLEDGF